MGCAQCHDHRYDPIPQTDYYRLRAVIEPAYDPKNWRTPGPAALSLYTDADRKAAAEVEAEAQEAGGGKNREAEAIHRRGADEAPGESLSPSCGSSCAPPTTLPADKRTPEQKKLLADNPEREHQRGRALSV